LRHYRTTAVVSVACVSPFARSLVTFRTPSSRSWRIFAALPFRLQNLSQRGCADGEKSLNRNAFSGLRFGWVTGKSFGMRALTNAYHDCALINLEPQTPGGTYVVAQKGYAPGDPALRERLFILQRDGRWLDQVAHHALPPEEQFQGVFETVEEVIDVLRNLTGAPVVVPFHVTEDHVRTHLQNLQTSGSTEAMIRKFLAKYRASKGGL
jgi:hypothetical protein